MTQRVQTQRSIATLSRPANTRPQGELSVNFADRQLTVIDDTPAAQDLLPIRWHSPRAQYAVGQFVVQGTGFYQCKTAITTPKAFNAADWNQITTQPADDARYLQLSGGVLTGLLTLSGAPTANLHAATKLYADTQDALRLPLTGGVLTGALTVGGLGVTYSGIPAGNQHNQAFGWSGTRLVAYVDGASVGNVAIGDYLPLTGGTVNGNVGVTGNLLATGGVYVAPAPEQFGFYVTASDRIFAFASTSYWDWNAASGNLAWSSSVGFLWNLRTSDALAFNAVGAVGGNGAYVNISDERTKTDIGPSPYGMTHIAQLQPILFHRLKPDGTPAERVEIGFGAQQVQPIIPEAVTTAGFPNADTLAVSIDGIVAALVGAVQQLDQRLTLLEAPAP